MDCSARRARFGRQALRTELTRAAGAAGSKGGESKSHGDGLLSGLRLRFWPPRRCGSVVPAQVSVGTAPNPSRSKASEPSSCLDAFGRVKSQSSFHDVSSFDRCLRFEPPKRICVTAFDAELPSRQTFAIKCGFCKPSKRYAKSRQSVSTKAIKIMNILSPLVL